MLSGLSGGAAERAADVLDMGCSGGFSSEASAPFVSYIRCLKQEMAKIFPQAKVTGLATRREKIFDLYTIE